MLAKGYVVERRWCYNLLQMSLLIRFANPEDFALVRHFDPHSGSIDPVRIQHKLSAQEIILAFDATQPVGIIRFCYIWSVKPYLDLIWVSQSHRSQGIGTQLLHFLETDLLKHGYTHLMTSSMENEPAPQKWHKQHGFREIGQLADINLPDDDTREVFFIKELTPITNSQEDE